MLVYKNLTYDQYRLLEKIDRIFTHNWYLTIQSIKRDRKYNSKEEYQILTQLRKHYIEYIVRYGDKLPTEKIYINIGVSTPRVNPITGKYVLRPIMDASGSLK